MRKYLLLLFLFAPSVALGDTCSNIPVATTTVGSHNIVILVSPRDYIGDFALTDAKMSEFSITMLKSAGATCTMYGVVWDNLTSSGYESVATSTNSISCDDIGTASGRFVFSFNEVVDISAEMFVGVWGENMSGSNPVGVYAVRYADRGYGTAGSSLSYGAYTYDYTNYEWDCTPTECEESGTMECDMASTTEAIYTVGYSVQMYLGILLLLIFGYLSYIFFRSYIKV